MNAQQDKGYILIVDDEPAWRAFSQVTLTKEGYSVETASALGEALTLLQQDGYDLVVVNADLLEPEEREILDKLVTRCKGKRLVIVSEPFLSRTRSLAESRQAFKMGASDWVSKPLGKRTLLDFINALLTGRSKTVPQA
jgi:DNA-binding response OmpR family regulator